MQLTAEYIGRRVTLRHRDGDGARDVIGRVMAVTDVVTIERRDGSTAEVPLASIIVWKVVPDHPARSRRASSIDVDELETITSLGWPAVESVALGDWELRASGGFTGRANSALILGEPGVDLERAVDQVAEFYAERNLRPLVQVVVGSAGETQFRERRWEPLSGARPGAIVQVADLNRPYPLDPGVELSTTLTDDWLTLYQRAAETNRNVARQVLAGPQRVAFASVGSPPVGIGRVVVTGEWAGLASVEVDTNHRRNGLASRIVSSMLAWASAQGADKAYLQTTRDNTAALALYERFGFATHHEYCYLTHSRSTD